MQVTTKAIVLTTIKYGDTSLIVRMFTFSDGIKSYLLRGIRTSKKGKLKTAYFQPLTQLDIVASHKNKGNLENIIEAKVNYHYQTLHSDISKNAITFFLAEMLGNSIHEEERNEGLFNFIEVSLQWLDMHDKFANFHLYFLLALTKFLGFYPDSINKDFLYFDLLEGEFINSPSCNPILSGDHLNAFKVLLGTDFDTLHSIKLNKKSRQELLKTLVLYFELHLQGFRKPKSVAVLNDVFN